MSALAQALAAYAQAPDLSQISSAMPIVDCPPSPLSIPELSHSGPSSSSSSIYDLPTSLMSDRPNEHLAVLLPKQLWKPDHLATACDNFYCRVSFGIFERRHHCRKCGGVFCAACSSRATPLLDTSNLNFFHPPRNVPISAYNSPASPVVNSRVCDDCFDSIHGVSPAPHTPPHPPMKRTFAHAVALFTSSSSASESSLSSRASSPSRHHLDTPISPRNSLRKCPSISSMCTSSSAASSASPRSRSSILRAGRLPLPTELERSYGELDAYPLKRSSVLCKATGGGRWEPKQSPVLDGYRPPVPGAKAPFELEMERQEAEARKLESNPIVTDGEFRYRLVRRSEQPSQPSTSCRPFPISTF